MSHARHQVTEPTLTWTHSREIRVIIERVQFKHMDLDTCMSSENITFCFRINVWACVLICLGGMGWYIHRYPPKMNDEGLYCYSTEYRILTLRHQFIQSLGRGVIIECWCPKRIDFVVLVVSLITLPHPLAVMLKKCSLSRNIFIRYRRETWRRMSQFTSHCAISWVLNQELNKEYVHTYLWNVYSLSHIDYADNQRLCFKYYILRNTNENLYILPVLLVGKWCLIIAYWKTWKTMARLSHIINTWLLGIWRDQ